MWLNPQGTVDLVTFTEEILNGKLHFLYSAIHSYSSFKSKFSIKDFFIFCALSLVRLFPFQRPELDLGPANQTKSNQSNSVNFRTLGLMYDLETL